MVNNELFIESSSNGQEQKEVVVAVWKELKEL